MVFAVFKAYLKLFHPFLPFITEKLWQELVGDGMLIRAAWPLPDPAHDFAADDEGVEAVVRLIAAVRAIRASNFHSIAMFRALQAPPTRPIPSMARSRSGMSGLGLS